MDYDKMMEKSIKENALYLEKFEEWLKNKKLGSKTIKKHVDNAYLYINDFLNYYDFNKMEKGCYELDNFLGDWFIRKCLWSSVSSLKATATSIKKFYQCMNELGYIKNEEYNYLCEEIKDNMEYWIETMNDYDNECFDYF